MKTISETYKNDWFLFKIESELEPKIFVKGRIMLSLLNKLDKNEIWMSNKVDVGVAK